MKFLTLITFALAGTNLPADPVRDADILPMPFLKEDALEVISQIRTAMTPTLKKQELIAVVEEMNETQYVTADSLVELFSNCSRN